MIGADTNLLVRFLTKDDAKQAEKVKSLLLDGETIYINEIVLSELFWVLNRVYQISKNDFVLVLDTLLETENIRFFDHEIVKSALSDYIHSRADYPDCLIHRINDKKNLDTLTFDKRATSLTRMQLLQ
tara:strand:+ start:3233 stop:3616 length:384 start_codon:yes stop_codon:yes gene_type:complete